MTASPGNTAAMMQTFISYQIQHIVCNSDYIINRREILIQNPVRQCTNKNKKARETWIIRNFP